MKPKKLYQGNKKVKHSAEARKIRDYYFGDYYLKDFKYISPEIYKVRTCKAKATGSLPGPVDSKCKSSLRKWFNEVMSGLKQFFYLGSLHGVKYIFEPSLNRKERATWILIVAVSLAMCSGFIIQLFSKSSATTPFVNVIDSLPTPIWAIPFPSVVLCPHLHVRLSYANVSRLNGIQRFFASQVCPQMYGQKLYLKHKLNVEENKMMQDFILQGSPKCSDVIKACSWRGTRQHSSWMIPECCSMYFKPVFTNYGLCYAFNGLPLNGMTNATLPWQKSFNPQASPGALTWGLDSGYPKVFPPDLGTLPYRVTASGESNGLGVELYLNKSEYQAACEGSSVGFNLLISSPTNHVYTTTVLRLPMDRMTTIEVYPITYKTDSNLRSLTPQRRQCYFQNERQLTYYEFYTDSNCKHDLLLREAVKACKCVPYNWPRIYVWNPVCSTESDFKCITEVRAKVEEQLIYAYFAESEEQGSLEECSMSCHPSCNDVLYSSQVFYSDFLKEAFDGAPRWGQPTSGQTTRLNVHFHDDMFLGQHRHAQYDDYYFIGAIGGLLSLFLGFSIISVAELVYFVGLRPIGVLLGLTTSSHG